MIFPFVPMIRKFSRRASTSSEARSSVVSPSWRLFLLKLSPRSAWPDSAIDPLSVARPMSTMPIYRNLLWIVLLAFTLRFVARWHSGEADFWVNGYTFFFEIAQNIIAGKGIALDGGPPTAFRVPVYPAFLAAVTFGHKVFLPVLVFQSLIGVGTVCCGALLAAEMFGSSAAITAAALTAIYPYYVVHDTALQETSLYTFLTALAVLLLLRVRRGGSCITAMCAGLTLGLTVLTRATLAPFAVLAVLWLALPDQSHARPWQRRLWAVLLCTGVAALTVSPWLVRSYRLTGSVALSTEAGRVLWAANNPYTFSHYPNESIDSSKHVAFEALGPQEKAEIEALGTNEASVDQWFRRKGLEYIREHPWLTFSNGFRKVTAAFDWLPSPRRGFWPNLVHALSFGPVMLLGLWGMWLSRHQWNEHLIFYGLFVSFAAVTAIFHGHTSHRVYLDLYWIVFAAGALGRFRVYFLNGSQRQCRQLVGPLALSQPASQGVREHI
jgi:4-amino-4-deoxy-L-arabinose transferase-like glycosyltransferase